MPKTDLLQRTLDLLLLRVLSLGPNHGWDLSNRLRQISLEGGIARAFMVARSVQSPWQPAWQAAWIRPLRCARSRQCPSQ